jgi:cellulose synthase operon protein YhjQ
MPLVCVTSPKGGVGRTTLAATLGVALHRLGRPVVALDLDRQNALRLNFELPDDLPGLADEIDGGRDWNELTVETPAGIALIPFGTVSAAQALRVSAHVARNPGWLGRRLRPLLDDRDLLVVADMPAGPSVFNVEIDPLADLHLLVLLTDAMSLALLPKLQHGDFLFADDSRMPSLGYVLNQVDPRRQLCRDVLALSRDVLGEGLYGMVHQDEGVAEAAACQLTVLDYAPDSVASQDVMAIARRVHDTLAPV